MGAPSIASLGAAPEAGAGAAGGGAVGGVLGLGTGWLGGVAGLDGWALPGRGNGCGTGCCCCDNSVIRNSTPRCMRLHYKHSGTAGPICASVKVVVREQPLSPLWLRASVPAEVCLCPTL